MKVAVSGASGFIGRHVIRHLHERRTELVLLCRDPAAFEKTQKQIAPNARVVAGDLAASEQPTFDDLGRPDILIHLAWGGLPNYHSVHHLAEEFPVQIRFLSGLVEDGLSDLLVTGTCFEYGMRNGPLDETMPLQPANCYAHAKSILLQQLQRLQSDRAFNLTWARLFYMYGEGQNPRSLYPLLVDAVARGDAVFPMSQGEQLRDFLRIEEIAGYIADLALLRQDIGAVNICSGRPISIRRLVETWLLDNGWTIELELGKHPYPDYEPMAFWGDAAKLRSLIDLNER
jgi:nucleoside-diphosphate-sugar epimerase